MRLLFTTLILLFYFPVLSQNYVPDSSFESFTNCPDDMGKIQSPMNPGLFPPTLIDWFSPMSNSPDYYNNCAFANSLAHIPNNTAFGYIPAHTGNGYVGIVAFRIDALNNTPFMSYREYVECQLTQPMIAGQTYYISAYTKSLVKPILMLAGGNFIALQSIEVHFSPTMTTNLFGAITVPGVPLTLPSQGFITDTNWVRVYGEYVATGGEQFMTIGTFNNNSFPPTQVVLQVPPAGVQTDMAYYFIDDVSVRTTPFPICDTITFVHDTTLCTTEPVTIFPDSTATTYVWNTGATSPNLDISAAGTYYRIATTGCYAIIDTYKVKLFHDTITASHNSAICAGVNSILLSSSQNSATYLWNNAATSKEISVTQAGTYYCTALQNCFLYTDTFHISSFQTYTSSYDTAICFPDTLLLSGEVNAQSYLWNTGATTYNISVAQPGNYSCEAIKGCDLYIRNFNVTHRASLESIDLGRDTLICKETKITIGKEYEGVTYKWNTGATTYNITPEQPGNYHLEVDDGCKISTDSILIDMASCEDCIYMPNAFTPNGDSKNDKLGIIAKCPLHSFSLKIFNRFGEMVYESKDVSGKWNGTYKGQRADLGVYFYYIEYTTRADKKNHLMKGDITLIY